MQLQKIKDDLYVPEDFSKNHNYFADAEGTKRYTGITSVISVLAKPALIGWAARMACEYAEKWLEEYDYDGSSPEDKRQMWEEARTAHAKKKEAAGEHGTDSHALVEEYVNFCIKKGGAPSNVDEDRFASIQKFIDWAVENVDHFLFSERRMCDKELFLAGTADFACVMKDGKKLMGDFKTSSGIYGIDYWLQVAAYRMLAEGEGDEPYDGSVVARLGKDGQFEVQYRYDYETDKEAFLACLTIYRAQATYKKPN